MMITEIFRSDLTPEEQLDEIAKHVRPLYELRDQIFAEMISK